jgi:hypothetical protein
VCGNCLSGKIILQGHAARMGVGEGKSRRLVPNAVEQAALEGAMTLRGERKSLPFIAGTWDDEFSLPLSDPKSVKRILERAAQE